MNVKRGFYFEIKNLVFLFNSRIETGREGKREWMNEWMSKWMDG
jgi:hypothetical protein